MRRCAAIKKIAKRVLRHALRFIALLVISFGAPQFFFPVRNVGKSYMSPATAIQQNVLCLLVGAALFAVTAGITSANDLEFAARWRAKQPKESFFSEIRFLLTDPLFLVKAGVFALLLLILPLPVLSLSLSELLGIGAGFVSKLPVVPAAALICLILALPARRHAIALFREGYLPEEKKNVRAYISMLVLSFSFIAGVGVIVIVALPFFVALLSSLFHKSAGRILLTAALIAAVVFIVVSAVQLLRRRRFMKDLGKLCARAGFALIPAKRAWLSVLRFRCAESFRIEANGKTYSCMMICVRRRRVPVYVDVAGFCIFYHCLRLWGDEVFHYETKRRIDYPTEHRRILIFSPSPNVLKCRENGQTADIDNGAGAGAYKVFSRGAFLRALERGSLDR